MRPSKRKLPKFRRQEWWRHRALREGWRKPRGIDSKMRLGKKGKPARVKIGYRQPKVLRGLHPSGLREVLVRNPREIEGLNPSKQAIRLSSRLGRREREKLLLLAKERGIKVLNP